MLQKLNNQGYTFTDNGRVIVVDKYGAVKRLTNLSLTTIGTTGPATLIGNVLNIPDYTETYFGTVTSVGLTMPAAFSVANSPITTAGTINVTAAGLVSQYIRGDGTLADFPGSTGGGSSVAYYLNGSVNQGTFGGTTYYQMSRTSITGTGTNFSIAANGYIASFITDVADPSLISIPSGSWNIQFYMNADSAGGSPNFYVELYKYDGVSFTLISSGSATPENITGGASIDLYYTSISVPTTALTVTDRLAVRVYVNNSGKTITFRTEGTNLAEIVTTFTTGLTALNGLTAQVQYFTTGTSGTDFTISSALATHTFNLPVASALNTGKLSNTDWVTFNAKQDALSLTTTGSSGASTLIGSTLNVPAYTLSGLGGVPTSRTLTVNGTSYDLSVDRSWSVGTVTSVAATAGTGISISGSPITGSGTLTITNTAPDQTVALTAGTGIGVSGTYPNFTITNSAPSPAGAITGSGTTNYVSKFTGSSALGNSQIQDNGTGVGIGMGVGSSKLNVRGSIYSDDANGYYGVINATNGGWFISNQGNSAARISSTFTYFLSNTAIGTSTDAGFRLDVNGTARVQSTLNVSGNTKIGNTVYSDANSALIVGINGTSSARGAVANNSNYQDFIFVNTNISSGNINSWSFGQRWDTYFGNTAGSFQIVGAYINNSGNGSMVGGGFRVPLIANPNGDLLLVAASNSVNGNVGIGTTSPAAILDVSAANNEIRSTGTSSTYTQYNAFIPSGVNMRIGAFATNNGFLGTTTNHPFTIETNNTQRARFFANGNLLIGSGTTDGGYRLDVSGTARVRESLFLLRSDAAATVEALKYTTANTVDIGNTFRVIGTNRWQNTVSSTSYIENGYTTKTFVTTNPVNGNFSSYDFSASNAYQPGIANPYTQKLINGAMTINSTAATNSFHGISISATDNSASIANNVFAVYADATLGTNGSATRWAGYFIGRGYFSSNLLLGTTTDGGQRLQVNGTSRLTGDVTIVTTTNSRNITFENSTARAGVNISQPQATLTFNNGGTFELYSNNLTFFTSASTFFTGFQGGAQFIYRNTSSVNAWATLPDASVPYAWGRKLCLTGGTTITVPNASAVLEVQSTTMGFLPPRMTTTQKNAITSPAAGLIVYDTTLNKLCVYTTAWETITSV
jgi:hypothetical protein